MKVNEDVSWDYMRAAVLHDIILRLFTWRVHLETYLEQRRFSERSWFGLSTFIDSTASMLRGCEDVMASESLIYPEAC